ncbi:MAG TPA: hypothetical protein VE593_05065 [Nitrososphaeraceae archaeon]|nr:hypothetical protein [Nitrososphaeraceae archaeon]
MEISWITSKKLFFLTLIGALIIGTSYMLRVAEARAVAPSEVPLLQNLTVQTEEKFQQVFGCKDNATCGAQSQNFPFVLPFP